MALLPELSESASRALPLYTSNMGAFGMSHIQQRNCDHSHCFNKVRGAAAEPQSFWGAGTCCTLLHLGEEGGDVAFSNTSYCIAVLHIQNSTCSAGAA